MLTFSYSFVVGLFIGEGFSEGQIVTPQKIEQGNERPTYLGCWPINLRASLIHFLSYLLQQDGRGTSDTTNSNRPNMLQTHDDSET